MDEQELIARVKMRAGLRTTREAKRALEAALGAVRCALADEDARALANDLPAWLTRLLERPGSNPVRNVRALYEETERREHVELGFAIEHAQVVLQVLAELLDPEIVVRLRKRLPADLADLFRARAASVEPPVFTHEHPAHLPAPRQTLSSARPGTAEPIADTHHVLAHEQSVARSAAPHAERSIATAHSTRPGLEDQTLAHSRGRA